MRLTIIIATIFMILPLVASGQSRRANRELSPAQVQRLASEAVGDVLPDGLDLQEVRWNQRMRVPRGELDAVAYLEGDEPIRGRLRARVEFLVNDESYRTIRVRLLVRDRRQVVVATRGLRPGDVIGANDVTLREPPPGVYIRNPHRELEDVVGNVVSQSLDSGEVVEENEVRPPAAVRRRERIRIVARVNGIEVIAQGEPLEDGAVGDIIRVTCLSTRRSLEARVVGPGVVEVR